MPESQAKEFLKEQAALLESIIFGGSLFPGVERKIEATVPIVFKEHKKYQGRAYLPVIIRHTRVGSRYRFKIIYIDVTGATRLTEDGYFVCTLSAETLLEMETTTDVDSVGSVEK
jgi:hypothetical protein